MFLPSDPDVEQDYLLPHHDRLVLLVYIVDVMVFRDSLSLAKDPEHQEGLVMTEVVFFHIAGWVC